MPTRYLKTDLATGQSIASSELIPVSDGGTGASTKETARQNLGAQQTFNGIEDASKFGLSYSESTRTLAITYTSGAAAWIGGTRFTFSGVTSLQHAATTGKHYFYYNSSGTLVTATSPWDLLATAPLFLVYYNATTGLAIPFDERHPAMTGMDDATHKYNHLTRGTQLISGFSVADYTLNTAGAAALSYSVASGVIADEDLQHSCNSLADGGPYRILYRSGASGAWVWDDTSTTGILDNGTNIYYNQDNAGTWQLTPITANNTWVNYYLMAIPEFTGTKEIVVVMGQQTYGSLSLAQAEDPAVALAGITAVADEGVIFGRMTYRRVGSIPSNAQLAGVAAVRQNFIATVSGVAPSDHQSLTGRDSADAHPASSISVVTSGFTGGLAGVGNDAQSAFALIDTKTAGHTDTLVTVGPGGQSVFTASTFTANSKIDVYVNGVLFPREGAGLDWTRTVPTTITLSETVPQYAIVNLRVFS